MWMEMAELWHWSSYNRLLHATPSPLQLIEQLLLNKKYEFLLLLLMTEEPFATVEIEDGYWSWVSSVAESLIDVGKNLWRNEEMNAAI